MACSGESSWVVEKRHGGEEGGGLKGEGCEMEMKVCWMGGGSSLGVV